MTRYLAGVLSVIAVGTMLIAYGLLNPRVATADFGSVQTLRASEYDAPRAIRTADGVTILEPANGVYREAVAYPSAQRAVVSRPAIVERPAADVYRAEPVRTRRVVERAPQRDWKRTAMVVGGSSAAGAGIGGLIGGKKGALIGAALGGGAATWYELKKR